MIKGITSSNVFFTRHRDSVGIPVEISCRICGETVELEELMNHAEAHGVDMITLCFINRKKTLNAE